MNKSLNGIRQTALIKNNISLVYVDVSQPARELERSHLCGPAAGFVQAKALACVALLGAELHRPKESLSVRFRVSGPVAGILVENMIGGGLRGYTHNKVLNHLDTLKAIDARETLGELGEFSVVRSIPGKTISSAMVNVTPASLLDGLKNYFEKSLQRSVMIEIAAHSTEEGVQYSRALLIECMPDGDRKAFNKHTLKFKRGAVAEVLKTACSIENICQLLGAEDYKINEAESLRFKCRCSVERVEKMVAGLPDEDLKEMIHGEQSTRIVCHMCGETYKVSKELLWGILAERDLDLDLEDE